MLFRLRFFVCKTDCMEKRSGVVLKNPVFSVSEYAQKILPRLTPNLPSFYIPHVLHFTSLPYNTARNMNTEQK